MNVHEIAATISDDDKAHILKNQGVSLNSKACKESDHTPKRSSVEREWPKVGAVVTATNPWNGNEHKVEVVSNKKRKHKVEFETENGSRFHSPSPLCQYLFGKRVANGWNCISW